MAASSSCDAEHLPQDQGIRSRNIRNGWSRRENEGDGAATPPVAGPSGTSSPAAAAGPSTPGGLSSVAEDDDDDSSIPGPSRYASMPGTPATEEDNDLSMEIEASSSRITSVKASTSKQTVEATSSTKRKITASVEKSKKKAKKGSDDEYSDDEIQTKVIGAPKARYADRKPGSFAMCAECNKKVSLPQVHIASQPDSCAFFSSQLRATRIHIPRSAVDCFADLATRRSGLQSAKYPAERASLPLVKLRQPRNEREQSRIRSCSTRRSRQS